ncbi:MAG: 23S rRNA (guanosine(2251)-2'-O)-methyltransferase RlmB [Syntrophaceae bacterium]|nr:23S rRNA (guanosine(2251)-2'-O)-methyltransferase RlmB [Syntrophaceae bacterium]
MNRKHHINSRFQIVYGIHPVLETIKAKRRKIHEVLVLEGSLIQKSSKDFLANENVRFRSVSLPELQSLCGQAQHQGILARVGPFPYLDLEDVEDRLREGDGVVLVLDEIQDPQNLGGILRSAECFGVKAVILPRDRSVTVTASAEKASAGASAHIPVCQVGNLARAIDQLKDMGFWIYGAHCEEGTDVFDIDFTGRVVFAIGSEGKGVRRLTREKCDMLVRIPICGKVQSLNVTSATTILLSEVIRTKKR